MTAPPRWTPAEIENLRQLAALGKTRRQCREILGRALDGIVSRQGIKFHGNVIFRMSAKASEKPQDEANPAFLPLPGSKPKPLLALRTMDCRWPVGSKFCATDTGNPKLTYCSHHHVMSRARTVEPEFAVAAE
jgi:hypothetical protein